MRDTHLVLTLARSSAPEEPEASSSKVLTPPPAPASARRLRRARGHVNCKASGILDETAAANVF